MQFQKGESGNPAGRPRGIRDKRALLAEQLFEGDAEAVIKTALELAKKGDGTALRLCMERICPTLKQRPLAFELPAMENARDAAAAMAAITQGLAEGSLTAAEAADLSKFVLAFAKIIVAADHEARIVQLEQIAKDVAAGKVTLRAV